MHLEEEINSIRRNKINQLCVLRGYQRIYVKKPENKKLGKVQSINVIGNKIVPILVSWDFFS